MAHKILYLIVNIFIVFRLSLSQEACDKPLGLEDGSIPDGSLTASSQLNGWHGARYARLNEKRGATVWMAKQKAVGEYIQVDLGKKFVLTGVATQGRVGATYKQYIMKYYIAYGLDGKTFYNLTDNAGKPVIFQGENEARTNSLPSISARYFRLYAQVWKRNVCTQLELYGCQGKNCSINNGGCSEKCTQINDGQVKCGCRQAGYELVDGVCQDIDECSAEYKPCAQNCKNTNGSYECSCDSGYTSRNDGRSCDDINECNGNHTCDQICINVPGTYICQCKNGYKFGPDEVKCIDVDECETGTSGCEHFCHNRIGSFKCSCKNGYKLEKDRKSCADIDECDLDIDKCDGICLNKPGSYSCKCRQGFLLAQDGYGCNDINECADHNGNCSDTCINNQGSYVCTCPQGFQLELDERTCKDVDECQHNYGNCKHICVNKPGSYKCSCNAGYELMSDGYSCEDIDECTKQSPCDLTSTVCKNTIPSYRCDCKPGFEPKLGNSSSCQLVRCGAFSVDSKFTVSPPRCLLSDTNVYGDQCTFRCAAGYEPVDPANMRATCLANRQWSMAFPRCNGVKCPAIPQPSNGKLVPSECANGVRYPGTCSIRCNSGYNNVGPSSISCEKSGSFSVSDVASLGCRKDTIGPAITCPPGIVSVLPKGDKSMSVATQWKDPYANVGKITSSHDRNFVFPVGITTVTFTATTDDGQSDNCDMRVTILDKEAPVIRYCPKDQYVQKTIGTSVVNWPEPQFTDNVGVTSVVSSHKSGTDLSENEYNIVYTAKDHAGNFARCEFKVIVTAKPCSVDDFIVDAGTTDKQCQHFLGSAYCSVVCKQDRIFVREQAAAWYTCVNYGIWDPKPETVPDCVGYSAFVEKCPEGTVELIDAVQSKVCANCPPGTFYQNGMCEKCAVGYYQDKEKQLSCKPCPAQQGTMEKGAKKCKKLCIPGTYSPSRFPTHDEPCKLCSIGEYQPNFGSTSCLKCSSNTTTLSVGETSKADCGRKGYIKTIPHVQTNITEGDDVTFICHTSAYPSFTIAWKKVNPISNVIGGVVSQKEIYRDGKLIGKSYSISKATYYDRGVYMCETINPFGVVQRRVTLNVRKNI